MEFIFLYDTSFKNITFIIVLTFKDIFIKENNEYILGFVFDEDSRPKDHTYIP